MVVVDPLGTKAVILGLGIATFSKHVAGVIAWLCALQWKKKERKKYFFWLVYSLGIIVSQVWHLKKNDHYWFGRCFDNHVVYTFHRHS